MDKTIGALRKLLNLLYQEQARDWSPKRRRRKVSPKAQEVWEELIQSWWHPVGEKELEDLLSASNELHINFSAQKKVLYLPPLEKNNTEFVPVLSLKCDIDETAPCMNLRVMLVCRNGDNGMLQGMGFRLESPSNSCQEDKDNDESEKNNSRKGGRHDFYHAQLIQGFGEGRDVASINWLPCSQPSFPILADDPVTLIFSLLLTLYGKNYCWKFYSDHSLHLHDMKQYMDKLQPWIQWEGMTNKKK